MHNEGERPLRALLVVVLLTIVVSGTADLVLDAPPDWRSGHALYEVALIAGALGTTLLLWGRWARAERSLAQTRRTLTERQAERDTWRANAERALQGLGAAIDGQLERCSKAGCATYRLVHGRIVEIWSTRRNYTFLCGAHVEYHWGLAFELLRSQWRRPSGPRLDLLSPVQTQSASRPTVRIATPLVAPID